MKRCIALLLAGVVILSAAACGLEGIAGSGVSASRKGDVKDFTAVEVNGPFEVTVEEGRGGRAEGKGWSFAPESEIGARGGAPSKRGTPGRGLRRQRVCDLSRASWQLALRKSALCPDAKRLPLPSSLFPLPSAPGTRASWLLLPKWRHAFDLRIARYDGRSPAVDSPS
jgi:hypothetical protein